MCNLKKLNQFLTISLIFLSTILLGQNNVTSEEIDQTLGSWKGTLSYIDYTSNKPFSMHTNLNVKKGKNKNQLILEITYPNEPKANNKEKILFSKNGTHLNNHKIVSKEKLLSGHLLIITEHSGKDNQKKARIKNIYTIGKNQFVMRKEVKFKDSEKWMLRNEYNYER